MAKRSPGGTDAISKEVVVVARERTRAISTARQRAWTERVSLQSRIVHETTQKVEANVAFMHMGNDERMRCLSVLTSAINKTAELTNVTTIRELSKIMEVYSAVASAYNNITKKRFEEEISDASKIDDILNELKIELAKKTILLGTINKKNYVTEPQRGQWIQEWDRNPAIEGDSQILEAVRERKGIVIISVEMLNRLGSTPPPSNHLQFVDLICDELKRIAPQFSIRLDEIRNDCIKWPTRNLTNSVNVARLIGDIYEAVAPESPEKFFSLSLKQNLTNLGVEIDVPRLGQIGAPRSYNSELRKNMQGKHYEAIANKMASSLLSANQIESRHSIYIIRPLMRIKEMEPILGKILLN